MEHKHTKISTIIAADSKPALTEQCIRLLRETLGEFPNEIILVDDGCTDRISGDIRLIRNEKQIGAAAS